MIESDHKPGTQESNHELFQSLPTACSHSLNGEHVYTRDYDSVIRLPGSTQHKHCYIRKLGSQRKEIYAAKCLCGDVVKRNRLL